MEQFPTVFDRRAQRILLFRELVDCFQKTQRSIVLCDLKTMEKQLGHQHKLCMELAALGNSSEEKLYKDASATSHAHWNALSAELQEMVRRAQHLGRVQESLLRRSRRAQELLARMLATTAITYTPPVLRHHAASSGK